MKEVTINLKIQEGNSYLACFTNQQIFLMEKYLDFVNNYLTVEKFCEHNEYSLEYGNALLNEGKRLQEINAEYLSHNHKLDLLFRNIANRKKVNKFINDMLLYSPKTARFYKWQENKLFDIKKQEYCENFLRSSTHTFKEITQEEYNLINKK